MFGERYEQNFAKGRGKSIYLHSQFVLSSLLAFLIYIAAVAELSIRTFAIYRRVVECSEWKTIKDAEISARTTFIECLVSKS